MRIAILSFYSGVIDRGVEAFVHELSNRLVSLGHKVTVFQTGPPVKGVKYKTVKVSIKVKFSSQGLLAAGINQVKDILAGREFAVKSLALVDSDTQIIIPTNNRWQGILSRVWATRHHAKMIISGHGGPGIDERIALWSFPDVFVPLSSFQHDWAKSANPLIKHFVKIPNGVDVRKFSLKTKPSDVNLPHPIILCVGAMWPWMKRQGLLIKAVSQMPTGSLLLVGDGEGKDQLQKLGDTYLKGRFKIISLPYDQMPKVYTACDIFSYPTSSWEAFGIVLLEAMASGLPVVANDDPIRREIVGKAGLFVDPTNITAYAQALEKALHTNWGDKPRKQAEKFSWDKIAGEYDKLFRSLSLKNKLV